MSFANNSFNLKPSIKAFGVEFNRLSRKDLPLLGKWRNDPLILPHMDSDRIISTDVMNVWFNKIKNSPKYCAYLASKTENILDMLNKILYYCAYIIFKRLRK